MKKVTHVFILMFAFVTCIAQVQTSREGLSDYAKNKGLQYKQHHSETIRIADSLGIPLRVETGDAIVALSHFVNGFPRFIGTTNIDAAASTGASALWAGGSAGLNLSGNGITLAIWDGGRAKTDHQEFGSRLSPGDGATSISGHATHVSGTMIASGVDPEAKGMSYQASLLSYDWDDDDSEMATAAASGLQVSNHSYGYITGWYYNYLADGKWVWFGDTTLGRYSDYGFGAYEQTSHDWDTIAWLAPEYLIVKSAGNDRFEGPATQPVLHWLWRNEGWYLSSTVRNKDGGTSGFDCIPWNGVAKNILTIGAVGDILDGYQDPSDVVLASFSGTGPTDDGRIKPDLVANGTGLYSSYSTSTTAYATLSGTSMSTPNTSGSIGLLHQHHRSLTGSNSIRSATMKGLLIHTADEAGANAGPDYTFGWGLLDTRKAALLMSEDAGYGLNFNIRELSLNQGDTILIPVYTSGSEPISATMAWTDRPAEVYTSTVNDPTPMLVNDLDLQLMGDQDEISLPWKLDVTTPAAAATTGDNTVDNVEKIEAGTPQAQRTWVVRITHKGTLALGTQNFSLILSGITQPPATTAWNGSVSENWHTSANWSNGIPGAETDVTIADITVNTPVINASAWCHHLTIGPAGALTVNDGEILNIQGDLLIQSDSEETGSFIGQNPEVSGSTSVERFISAFTSDVSGWHLLSSPVATQPVSSFHTAGSGNDFYKWDETSGLWINRTASGGVLNETFETDFVPGRGYLVANALSSTKIFSGLFNDADLSITGLTRNVNADYAGWNLVGNPYPSAIAWNDGTNWIVPADYAGVSKVWYETGSSYIDRGAGTIIPSGNGFMVQLLTGSSGSLSIPLLSRTHSGENWYKSAASQLILTARDLDRSTAQQTIIAFRDGSTGNYDQVCDSRFLEGFAPVFYTLAGSEFLSTNTLPEIPFGQVIQLGFAGKGSEHFSIEMDNTDELLQNGVYLIDNKNGLVTNLLLNPEYKFTASESDNPARFTIYFGNKSPENPDREESFSVYTLDGIIYLASLPDTDVVVWLVDAFGKEVFREHTGGAKIFPLNARSISSGVYVVNLVMDHSIQSKKIALIR